MVTEINLEHNHATGKVENYIFVHACYFNNMHHAQELVYAHLPKQRRLDEASRSEAIQLLELKVNKKLFQQHLSSSKGKVVTLKDISNLKSELPTKITLIH